MPGIADATSGPSSVNRVGTFTLSARLLRTYAAGQWPLIAGGIVLVLAVSGIAILQPWPLKFILDSVVGTHPLPAPLAHIVAALGEVSGTTPESRPFLLLLLCIGIVVLQLSAALLLVASTYTLVLVGLRMVFRLRCTVFDHVQRLSLAFHESTTVGDSLYRVTWDTYSIQALFNTGLVPALTSATTLAAIFAVMFSRDWLLALFALGMAIPLSLLIRGLDRPMTERSLHVHARESDVTARVQETLRGIRAVQAFGREEHESARFRDSAHASLQANLLMTTLQTNFQAFVGLLFAFATAGVVWIAASGVVEGRLTAGDLVLLVSYLVMVQRPLETLTQTASEIQRAAAGARRVMALLSATPDVPDLAAGTPFPARAKGHLVLDHVGFGYGADSKVLNNVCLDIRAGESIALVGSSGAGKTTLASLLLRFYDPGHGRILLDGHDLRDVSLASLRHNISLVLQEPILFAASIRENIAYSKADADQESIRAAAKAAGIHDFIMSLPRGYETEIGEDGVGLSGGQRQRLSIARAFLKDAPVLVLDEPTSSLDAETEAQLVQSLEALMRHRTTIIISHRLSTIRKVDRIVVLQNGSIEDIGSHRELMSRSGLYAKLYRMQFEHGTALAG